MRDIEDRLRAVGRHVGGWGPQESLPGSTRAKIVRRRRASAALAGMTATFLGLGSAVGIANLGVDSPRISPEGSSSSSVAQGKHGTPTAEAGAPARVPLNGFGAVWPEDTADETADACTTAASTRDPVRSDAMKTALEFARVVLGWDAGGVVRAEFNNSKQIELRAEGDEDASAGVTLSMVAFAEDCWSVQSVHGISADGTGRDETRTVANRRTDDGQTNILSVRFDAPDGTAGTVEFGFGSYVETKRFVGGPGTEETTFRFGPIDPRDGGHFLILFEDDDGTVVSAIGAAMPSAQLRN